MNSYIGAWQRSTIRARLSQIERLFTPGRRSGREHWFQTRTPTSERLTSKPGLVSPRAKPPVRVRKRREKPVNTSTSGPLRPSSSERPTDDAHKINFGVCMSHVRRAASAGGYSDAADVERSA